MGSPAEPLKEIPVPAVEPSPEPVRAPARELPRVQPVRGHTALNATAAQVGRMIGTAFDTARKASVQTAALTERIGPARAREAAVSAVVSWKHRGQQKVLQIRHRTEQMVAGNPFYVIGAAAAAAFALGFTLRIWRSHHARS